MLILSDWMKENDVKIEVKNLTAIIITVKEIEYKCYFSEYGTERQKIDFLWLPQDKFHAVTVYKHHMEKLSFAILNAIEIITENKATVSLARIAGSSQVKLDTYQDFGTELWRMTFGNMNNYKQSQVLKGIKSLRDLIVMAIMLQEIARNLKENGFTNSGTLFEV